MNHRHTTAVRVTLIVLLALSGGPAAAVTVIVENIHGQVADSDNLSDGASDPFVEVWIDGMQVGTTPVLQDTNSPSWPSEAYSLEFMPSTRNTPMVTIELKVWDAESPGAAPEYQGVTTLRFAWQPAMPSNMSGPVVGPWPYGPVALSAAIRVAAGVIMEESFGWGTIKAAYR
jgi:hypothetical protein